MHRHENLRPLSRDHHFTLRHAKRLREAASLTNDERRLAVREFIEHWQTEALDHFAAEEKFLAPLMADATRDRLFREHAEVRALAQAVVESPESAPAELLRQLGEQLAAHIRWEELEAFPEIEAAANADTLAALAAPMIDLELRRDRKHPPGTG